MPSSAFGRLSLTYPDDFERASDFLGLHDSQRTTSIAVTTIPGPFSDVMGGMSAERLASRGIRWLGQEHTRISDQPAVIIHAAQTVKDLSFVKWIVVTGNQLETNLVTATVQQSVAPNMREAIHTVLRSIELKAADDAGENLKPSTNLTVEAPFGVARRFGDQVIYTIGGKFPTSSDADPILVASTIFTAVGEDQYSDFAVKRIQETATLRNIRLRTQQPVSFTAGSGMELIADALGESSNRPMVIYQVTVHSAKSGSVIIQGLLPAEDEPQIVPLFARAARSLNRNS
jgi:hypothetical protein